MKKLMKLMGLLLALGCSTDDAGSPSQPEEPQVEAPVAVDDQRSTMENTELTIAGLMENDDYSGYARITSFDAETEQGGQVTDNRDGTFLYEPPTDFIGTDSFSYTICDNEDNPNCSTAEVTIDVTAAEPVAEDDSYTTAEEQELVIDSYLDNDLVLDGATVTGLETGDIAGTATLESDGSITYLPPSGFVGEEQFSYTLCDDDEQPTCVTALITVDVTDEGNPEANDDEVIVSSDGGAILLEDLLENDLLADEAVLSAVAGGSGTVEITSGGKISYTPQANFTGTDSFTYTICDDDQPSPSCSEASVTVNVVTSIAFDIPAELQDYYAGLSLTTDQEVNYQVLSELTDDQHENILSYGERHQYLYDADEDLDNPDNVILMYTGESRYWKEYQSPSNDYSPQTFNTEHIYPQSLLTSSGGVTDLHHLRVADASINTIRSNNPFTEGSGEAGLVEGDAWYPGDQWKGDVARMVMYLNIRYGEAFSKVGNLELFLKWNREDPVSAFEMQRNEVIEGAQGNRNPFIDNPYLATLIWGGEAAENRW